MQVYGRDFRMRAILWQEAKQKQRSHFRENTASLKKIKIQY